MNKIVEDLMILLLECQKELGKSTSGNAGRLWWKIESHALATEWRAKNSPEFNTDTPSYQGRVWEQV